MSGTDGDSNRAPVCLPSFRSDLRRMFRSALERLSADGVVSIKPEELAGLAAEVRKTADTKFGDYSATMAMALAKRAGLQPRAFF